MIYHNPNGNVTCVVHVVSVGCNMPNIKVVVLLVRQLRLGFTEKAKVSPNLTVAHTHIIIFWYINSQILILLIRLNNCSSCTCILIMFSVVYN